MQIQGLYRSIRKVEIQDGLTSEGIEKMLMSNYYVGNNVYSYIIRNYSKSNPVTIYFQKSANLQIKAGIAKGKVVIFVPDASEDEFF